MLCAFLMDIMIKVGVFFGGASREREVSFAGGRTVYDNLDKELFQPIPIFVDALGNFIRLNWEYVYRGTIRDFFPTADYLPSFDKAYQIYSESLDLSEAQYNQMIAEVGEKWSIDRIAKEIDFAFLSLHGNKGEDGSLQGLLEWYHIPYSGSGILPSALGVSKKVQKKWWSNALKINPWSGIDRTEWNRCNRAELFKSLKKELSLPFVVKASNQGSSIGVQIVSKDDLDHFEQQVSHCFFELFLKPADWNEEESFSFIQELTDLRTGLGLPLKCNEEVINQPDILHNRLRELSKMGQIAHLQALPSESELIFEKFLEGREFSCIVIRDEDGKAFALPPTEVVKGKELFDYNSKYLPGLSHKMTPIQIEDAKVSEIRSQCVELFEYFEFEVYARIDGFITDEGVFLNDPNTTSGMMPSSFFFHQAAEIGLNPKNFISYIIRTSLQERILKNNGELKWQNLLQVLDANLALRADKMQSKEAVAVILGGYSSERHISVESGRNIYEKLASSVEYEPTPIFLTGSDGEHRLFEIPINIMLKDNADDIKAKLEKAQASPLLEQIRKDAAEISHRYTGGAGTFVANEIDYDQLADRYDLVFIALHGRPGEDGQVQKELDKRGVAYNGSGVESSEWTINKFETNKKLRDHGFLVADSLLVQKGNWMADREKEIEQLNSLAFPMICKPHDEGCSSAVIKIKDREMLEHYADLCFGLRDRTVEVEKALGLGPKDEFPSKDFFMAETFTQRGDADHFLEITGGLLTQQSKNGIKYEVFEPSEALSAGNVLSLAEKFLAGEGQNITPARFDKDKVKQKEISNHVKKVLGEVAKCLNVEGYCRIDAFVRIYANRPPEVVIIEINSLPGMTPATCIYHQAALNNYKPFDFIHRILQYGKTRQSFGYEAVN